MSDKKKCPNCGGELMPLADGAYECPTDKIVFSVDDKGALTVKAMKEKGKIQELEEKLSYLEKDSAAIMRYLFGNDRPKEFWE